MSARLAGLAGLALLLAAPAALAQGVGTPLGEGALRVDLDGAVPAATYDPGAEPLPGDDTLLVEQGLREAGVVWTGAPVGLAAEAGLRGFVVRQGAVAALDAAFEDLERQVPPGLLAAWPWLGPEGFDLSLQLFDYGRQGGADPLTWQAMMLGQPWGPSYDAVVFPTALDGSSEGFAMERAVALHTLCDYVQRDIQVALGACQEATGAVQALAPDLRFHSENPAATAALRPEPVAEVLGLTSLLDEATPAAPVGAPGADMAELEAPRLDRLLADLGTGAGFAPPPVFVDRGGAGPTAQQAGTVPLAGPATLPLAVAALALPLLAWALYRRIQPSRALHHPVREDLLRRVRAHPGIHESQLAREMGLRHTHVQYHIRVLAEAGVLETRRFGGLKCLFELGRHSPSEKAYAMADRGRSREVLLTVGQQPGIAQRELARTLAMSESSVKWHLDRLEQAGMVRTERARGAKRAWPMPGGLAPVPPMAPAVELPAAPPVAALPATAPPAPL